MRDVNHHSLPATRILHDMEAALDRMGSWDLYVAIGRAFAEFLPETEQSIADTLERKSWSDARRLVHALKSNCAAVGAEELRGRVYLLEKACSASDEDAATALFKALRDELHELRADLLAL